jgi:hypothetical protein
MRSASGFLPVALGLLLTGCGPKSPASGGASESHIAPSTDQSPAAARVDGGGNAESASPACSELMQPFVDALWDGNAVRAEARIATPLNVVHQEIEPGEGDPPYELASPQTIQVSTQTEVTELLSKLATRVSPRDGDLVPRPRDSAGTSWDATFNTAAHTDQMRRCVITMAVGDTEHVLIVAFDATSDGKARALYWN